MAGVGDHHLAALRVEREVDARDEDIVLVALEHEAVDAPQRRGGIALGHCGHAQVGGDARHEQRGGHALARDVTDEDADASIVEPEHVVEVAADGVRGSVVRDELDARHVGELLRQKALLDLLGEREVLLEPLLLERLLVELGVLQRHRGLRRERGEQVQIRLREARLAAITTPNVEDAVRRCAVDHRRVHRQAQRRLARRADHLHLHRHMRARRLREHRAASPDDLLLVLAGERVVRGRLLFAALDPAWNHRARRDVAHVDHHRLGLREDVEQVLEHAVHQLFRVDGAGQRVHERIERAELPLGVLEIGEPHRQEAGARRAHVERLDDARCGLLSDEGVDLDELVHLHDLARPVGPKSRLEAEREGSEPHDVVGRELLTLDGRVVDVGPVRRVEVVDDVTAGLG